MMLTKMISGDKNISEEREGNMAGNELLIVDAKDQEIGYCEKMEVHRKGVLHRAFSVFLLDADSGMLLLQKRNQEKYHSGGLWSNSCCSHQYQGETLLQAVNRCMKDELGIGTEQCSSVAEAGVFTYFSDYGEIVFNLGLTGIIVIPVVVTIYYIGLVISLVMVIAYIITEKVLKEE